MSSTANDWPELDEGYTGEFGPIDATVYATARALWPRARSYADARLHDEGAGRRLLLKAAAAVSRQELNRLEDLNAYLWRSFIRLVLDEWQRRQHDLSADDELAHLPQPSAVKPDDSILLDEMLEQLDKQTRRLLQLHYGVGYSYEELAPMLGKRANMLRSQAAKGIKRVSDGLCLCKGLSFGAQAPLCSAQDASYSAHGQLFSVTGGVISALSSACDCASLL